MKIRTLLCAIGALMVGLVVIPNQVSHAAPVQQGRFQTGVPNGEIVVNLTVAQPQAAGWLAAYPCGGWTGSSNVNFAAGQTTSTAAILKADANGEICLHTSAPTEVIVDMFETYPSTNFGVHTGQRMTDTRSGGRLSADGVFGYQAGEPGKTVLLNLTAVNPAQAGFLTVWPCDQAMPVASNVNFAAGDTVPNFVQTMADGAGKVCVYTSAETDMVIDQFAESVATGTHSPVRKLDTRDTAGARLVPNGVVAVHAANGPMSISFNLTAVNPSGAGYLTAYPCSEAKPETSNVNFAERQTRANFAKVRADSNGNVCIFSSVATDVLFDQAGEAPVNTASVAGRRMIDTRTTPAPPPPPPSPPTPTPTPTPACTLHSGTVCVNVIGYSGQNGAFGYTKASLSVTNEAHGGRSYDLFFTWSDGDTDTDYLTCMNPGETRSSTAYDWDHGSVRLTSVTATVALNWDDVGGC